MDVVAKELAQGIMTTDHTTSYSIPGATEVQNNHVACRLRVRGESSAQLWAGKATTKRRRGYICKPANPSTSLSIIIDSLANPMDFHGQDKPTQSAEPLFYRRSVGVVIATSLITATVHFLTQI